MLNLPYFSNFKSDLTIKYCKCKLTIYIYFYLQLCPDLMLLTEVCKVLVTVCNVLVSMCPVDLCITFTGISKYIFLIPLPLKIATKIQYIFYFSIILINLIVISMHHKK